MARGSDPVGNGSTPKGDVPYWYAKTNSRTIWQAGSWVGVSSLVVRTGMERMKRRAEGMSALDMTRQLWLIDSFLGTARE
jgi:hypothetical protein